MIGKSRSAGLRLSPGRLSLEAGIPVVFATVDDEARTVTDEPAGARGGVGRAGAGCSRSGGAGHRSRAVGRARGHRSGGPERLHASSLARAGPAVRKERRESLATRQALLPDPRDPPSTGTVEPQPPPAGRTATPQGGRGCSWRRAWRVARDSRPLDADRLGIARARLDACKRPARRRESPASDRGHRARPAGAIAHVRPVPSRTSDRAHRASGRGPWATAGAHQAQCR